MNLWRDVALEVEVGSRVVTDMMTLEDWVLMIELDLSVSVVRRSDLRP